MFNSQQPIDEMREKIEANQNNNTNLNHLKQNLIVMLSNSKIF